MARQQGAIKLPLECRQMSLCVNTPFSSHITFTFHQRLKHIFPKDFRLCFKFERFRKTIKTIYNLLYQSKKQSTFRVVISQCKMTMAMVVALETPHRVLMLDPTCTDLLLYSPEEIAGRSINIFSGPKTDLNMIHTAIKGSNFRSAPTIDVVLYERCCEPRNVVFSCSAFLGITGNL